MNLPTATIESTTPRGQHPQVDQWRPDSFYYQPIASELAQAEIIFSHELDTKAPYVKDLIAHLAHYRGKRLRPTLLLLTAKATGQLGPEHPMLAAVVEMIHTATLVHDDILDSADLRRHVATINSRWGNASSVLLGDMLFTHAFHLASKTGSAKACEIIGEATNKVCEGELRQIGEQGNLDLTEADYYSIIGGKTAALTACCCELGALFAGASSTMVEAMTRFGYHLGIAFQVADDVLDIQGTEKMAGKSLGTDVLQKKLTLPLIHLLQQRNSLSDEARDILENPDTQNLTRLRYLLAESGSMGYTLREAEKHVQAARDILKQLPRSEASVILDELMKRIVCRES
jgi:octaprenyl-diphosphate synthase